VKERGRERESVKEENEERENNKKTVCSVDSKKNYILL
jgi:hypothetical protein